MPGYVSSANGVVDKQGWYRIAKIGADRSTSCVIILKRTHNSPSPEYQKVQFLTEYNLYKFASLAALSSTHMWTKIRATKEKENEYIEIYQNVESFKNNWFIFIEGAIGPYSTWKAMEPVLTQETVSGVTVLASLDLPANNPD